MLSMFWYYASLSATLGLALTLAAYKSGLYIPGISRRRFPDTFKLCGVPPPTPLPKFDIDNAKPRPYRPFRWEYHQTMSLKKMEPDWWLELESTYRERIAQRVDLYAKHGKKVVDALPGSELACQELMQMAVQFLCTRYPEQFQLDESSGILYNHILGTSYNVDTVPPLIILLENVPEDFLIVLEDKSLGLYCLAAGVSCSAVGWNLTLKIGKPLHEIHTTVPDYKEKMQMSMDRYISKMPADKPIQRGSWGLEKGQPLFLSPEDPHLLERVEQDSKLDINDIYLRVDWQTLRRLPRSRGVVFNFKALFTPVVNFRNEPYIPKLLLKILREGKKSIMEYKGTHYVEHKMIPALELWAKEQEDLGLVPVGWRERTLNEDPYYPGWKKDWEN